MTATKRDRPRPVGLPGCRARVIRGPRDGRWYWRAELPDGSTVWAGWATPREAAERVAEIVSRGDLAPRRRPRRDRPGDDEGEVIETIDQLVRGYLAHLEETRPELAEATFTAYRLQVRQLRDAGVATFAVARLDAAGLEAAKGALMRRLSPRSVEQILYLVGAAWRWGRREGVCPDRELVIPRIPVPLRPRRTPTSSEIARVVDAITVPWARLCVRMLWGTGARIGEIAALTWDRVDLEQATIVLEGKTGAREVPIGDDLVAELRAWRRWSAGDHVLGVTFHTVRQHTRRALQVGCEAAGVKYFTPHALRRAAVDALAREGVDVSTAAALLGHSPTVMLSYYRQVTRDDLRAASRALAKARR